MGIDFGSLIIDLETLASCSNEDFSREFWSEYENYLKKYNSLLKDLQTLGFFKEMNFIKPVPFSDQSFDSGFSEHEKAKLREVANASNILLGKVRLLLSPKKVDRLQDQVRSNKIFLTHGNDKEMKQDVVKTLQTLELDPVILHMKPDKEQTMIETINEYNHVTFAIVLLSPDYLAYPKERPSDEAKFMADQNIIFELGYLLGKLGKENVILIHRKQKDLEIPKDFTGIYLIEYKNGWYFDLIKTLKDCNFDVDANKLSWL